MSQSFCDKKYILWSLDQQSGHSSAGLAGLLLTSSSTLSGAAGRSGRLADSMSGCGQLGAVLTVILVSVAKGRVI